jgi:hypothetical protein
MGRIVVMDIDMETGGWGLKIIWNPGFSKLLRWSGVGEDRGV